MKKFYIDFEATQPGNEIIAFGVISDGGAQYRATVKPKQSVVTPYIAKMTGIHQDAVEDATSFEFGLNYLGEWCYMVDNPYDCDWEFHCYGDTDKDFVRTSAKYADLSNLTEKGLYALVCLQNRLIDDSKEVFKFFNGSISLIKAYNFAKDGFFEQVHDPLEDAMMLQFVQQFITNNAPLKEYPFKSVQESVTHYEGLGVCANNFKMPSGKFFCQGTGKNAKAPREFESCDAAIDWLISTFCSKTDRDRIRRDRIATKIMISMKKGQTYQNFKWWREK